MPDQNWSGEEAPKDWGEGGCKTGVLGSAWEWRRAKLQTHAGQGCNDSSASGRRGCPPPKHRPGSGTDPSSDRSPAQAGGRISGRRVPLLGPQVPATHLSSSASSGEPRVRRRGRRVDSKYRAKVQVAKMRSRPRRGRMSAVGRMSREQRADGAFRARAREDGGGAWR